VTLRKAAFKRPFKENPLSRGCLKSLRLEITPADMACQTRHKFEVVVCKGHRPSYALRIKPFYNCVISPDRTTRNSFEKAS